MMKLMKGLKTMPEKNTNEDHGEETSWATVVSRGKQPKDHQQARKNERPANNKRYRKCKRK